MQGEPPTSLPLPPCRFEHVRVLEARLAAQAADLQREAGSRATQVRCRMRQGVDGRHRVGGA